VIRVRSARDLCVNRGLAQECGVDDRMLDRIQHEHRVKWLVSADQSGGILTLAGTIA
jgi:hypothetical protein